MRWGVMKRKCDHCKYEFGEWCTHPIIREAEERGFRGDLWSFIDIEPPWCPLKDGEDYSRKEYIPYA